MSTPQFSDDVLVPVVDAPATRRTVEYAVDRIEAGAALHLVALASAEDGPPAQAASASLLGSARRWAERARPRDHEGRVVTAGRAVDGRWPTADDAAAVLAVYAQNHGIDRVLVPADVERAVPGVTASALVAALRDAGVASPVVGPTPRTALHRHLVVAGSLASTGALFVLSLAFYLLLAGRIDGFELVTGVATAAVVAATFRHVTFATPPALVRSTGRAVRGCLYVPYLLWEVAKANAAIAAIVLHPRLPIDPKLVSYDTTLDGELALTTFANSVTLTPGTLTVDVDVDDGTLLVHTLTASTRADLLDGSLERAVQFVFGSDAAATDESRPTPTATTGEGVLDD
jgi:multicomponent Na+:H+ antiporter subunit E